MGLRTVGEQLATLKNTPKNMSAKRTMIVQVHTPAPASLI